ncbi:glycosyltransferase [Paenibacillus allorhizosphaerae]|uniref:D-inositol-3-phosphate glycosyltransferase n=1 Tax=Paenibacillus allorhizosphaerae TaxID=2849866 RepID=A0ABM8VV72_9BACL|nr:glycosyltransferase [Paenibacillus allorhizosphaerae]CAG7659183.1 D-inositol-3-phosphate glycosyltransferase [Paenibacillus allorhizosphaerae]
MRILIDIQTLYTPEKNRGIGIYTYNWIKGLINQDSSHRYYLMRRKNEQWEFTFASQFIDFDQRIMEDRNWEVYSLEEFLERKNIDVIHFTSPHMFDIEVPDITSVNIKKSYLVYDLIPLVMKDHYYNNWSQHIQRLYDSRCKLIAEADCILTISEASKKDLVNYLGIDPDRIHVIYASTNEELYEASRAGNEKILINKELGISSPFIYSLTGYDPRKNNKGLISAFSQVVREFPDIKLVISGIKQEAEREELIKYATTKGITPDQIIYLGFVSDDSLVALYKECEVFVFPSIYEGFGLPVLEAMRCGTPVVTTSSSSLPEVAGDAAIIVDVNDDESMATAINSFLKEKGFAETYKTKGVKQAEMFSWSKTTLDSLKVFHNLVYPSFESASQLLDKLELAFFSPLNPQSSGISDYSEELLTELRHFFDVKIFVNGITPENPFISRNFEVFDYTTNYERLEKIKLRMYHMGNNELHSWIYNAMIDYPGYVVLHDLNLYGFYMYTKYLRGDKIGFVNELTYCHGQDGSAAGDRLLNQASYPNDQEFPMFKKVVELSNQVLVHSHWVKEKIEIESDFKGVITVIPSGILMDESNVNKKEFKRNLGLDCNKISIGIFGNVIPNKRIEVILRALSELVKTNNNIHVNIVGHCSTEMEQHINKAAKHLDFNKHVSLIKGPTLDVFKQYIIASDICINLRWPTFGETSATLVRSLGYGTPCIVSNVGSYIEYPDDCVWKVDVDEYENELLLAYLLELTNNDLLREKMGYYAKKYMKETHDFGIVAGNLSKILSST